MRPSRLRPAGRTSTYGVLVGTIKAGQENASAAPHYEIWIEGGGDFRAAVNIRSVDGSEIYALLIQDYTNPTRQNLPALAAGRRGFTPIATGPNGSGLDYLRDNLFDLSAMRQLPPDGGATSLTPDFDAVVQAAQADSGAVAIVFGAFYSDAGADETFGFSPEQGVHDIHMMQGNSGEFAGDNTVNGDGALFVRRGDGTVFAFFARFGTQSLTTDPGTGAPA